ncbi:OLC1v1031641C3 [Oldenlandia corymbosa var. corymbosa]|uniref:OLC1v1031641C3 n=1 Tax=Oldenlandia corymbosa var. corymbosa TaxID=529605 RepID=A0AAV1CJN0_OLDCO|nr:OLC1v1031641C3 [Oldenlandia corymbosa var. corymbosa]
MAGGTNQLISVQPDELHFQFELDRQSFCDLKVSNTTENYVAFKVKTTSPRKYFVRPNTGVIQPWDSSVIRVTLQAQREYPPDMQCRDKFLLQSTVVPPNTDVDELPADTFNKDSGRVVEECKLKVVYLTPNSSNPEDGSRRFIDSNIVSSCPICICFPFMLFHAINVIYRLYSLIDVTTGVYDKLNVLKVVTKLL